MYGVDVGDEVLLASRSWRWLRTKIVGLLTRPPGRDMDGGPVFTTRLQTELARPAQAPTDLRREG